MSVSVKYTKVKKTSIIQYNNNMNIGTYQTETRGASMTKQEGTMHRVENGRLVTVILQIYDEELKRLESKYSIVNVKLKNT